MVPDNHIRDERPEREIGEQDDPTLTTRVGRPGGAAEELEASGDHRCGAPGRYWRNRAADLATNQGGTKPAQAG